MFSAFWKPIKIEKVNTFFKKHNFVWKCIQKFRHRREDLLNAKISVHKQFKISPVKIGENQSMSTPCKYGYFEKYFPASKFYLGKFSSRFLANFTLFRVQLLLRVYASFQFIPDLNNRPVCTVLHNKLHLTIKQKSSDVCSRRIMHVILRNILRNMDN